MFKVLSFDGADLIQVWHPVGAKLGESMHRVDFTEINELG